MLHNIAWKDPLLLLTTDILQEGVHQIMLCLLAGHWPE